MQKVINKGNGTQPKYDRNVEMMKRYNAGEDIKILLHDYDNITSSRFHALRKSMGVPARSKNK